MFIAGIVLTGAVILTSVVTLGVRYWQYRNWPPHLWKGRVTRWYKSLQQRHKELQAPEGTGSELSALFNDHFGRYLRALPLETLDECPGIGPATVARLRDTGYRNLGAVTAVRFEEVPGIGPTRATALREAVSVLVRQARARFEAGACPEAQEYRRAADALQAAERERSEARGREAAAVAVALADTQQLYDLACDITFWTYLFHHDKPGVTETVMSRPLPTVASSYPPPAPAPRPVVAEPEVVVRAPVLPPPVPVLPPPAPVSQAVAPPPLPISTVAVAQAKSAKPAKAPVEKPSTLPAPPVRAAGADTAVAQEWLSKMRVFTRFAFVVAKSDGRVAQSERKVIRSFLATTFGHQDLLARHIDPLVEQVGAAVPAEAEVLAEVLAVTSEPERRELYRLAEEVADAAGERKERERETLERIARAFGITSAPPVPSVPPAPPVPLVPAAPVPGPERTSPEPAADPRTLLEIPAGAELTPALIRRRFAALSDKLDPARAREMGPEFTRLAEDKAARLRAAAEALIAPLGAPLEPPDAPPPPADLRHNPDLDDIFGG